jgi:2-octaprenyl-6-methoxyphenol hydroxylase
VNDTAPLQRIAIVGAGPVGLAFACAAAEALPNAALWLFDARPIDGARREDARALALSLGSIQWLRRLQAWPAQEAEAMTEVSVSQLAPGRCELRLRAAELGEPMLGAVLHYAALQQTLQRRWLALAQDAPQRCVTRGGQAAGKAKPLPDGRVELEVGDGTVEPFDLVVVAEGGVFAEQRAHDWRRDYAQTAWVGELRLGQDWPRGLAMERFTRDGPLAVLPLPDDAQGRRASLVWCLRPDDPGVTLARLQALLPRSLAGCVTAFGVAPRPFALGLNADPHPLHGRSLRLGNAAQALHPVAGQGLNLGLRDAHELLVQLGHAADGRWPLDAALQRWVARRRPDRLALLATTDLLARAFTWQAAPLALAREAGLRTLAALPWARHALARGLMFGLR